MILRNTKANTKGKITFSVLLPFIFQTWLHVAIWCHVINRPDSLSHDSSGTQNDAAYAIKPT